ncbi:hypothetical protein N8987_05735 [Crocinitomix sp.]|nr:hypothetical protein [Crocinitomix sp.]
MIRILHVLILLFISSAGFSQNSKFVRSDSIKGKFSIFSVDNFGRIYLCENDVIRMYYNLNDTVYTASLKSFRPTSIESSKSFRTLLFDQERSILHFFDNTLTDINGEINLVEQGVQQPVLVCESFAGNSFWILDGGMMRLIKMNRDLEITSQTENIVSLFDNKELPKQMLEYNDFLYVLIPNKGVAIFDVFGTFIKIYPTKATHIGALNNHLLLQTGNKIEAVKNDAFLMPEFTYTIPPNVKQFYFSNQKIYFLMDNKLIIGTFIKQKSTE